MKFCLVSASPNEGLDEREKNKSIAAFPPLSLLYLASALKENGVEVSVLDQPGQGLTVNETVNWVMKERPDVLGFSALSTSGKTAALISSRVKAKNPNIITIIGNHYATFNAHRILKRYPSVDIIVRGEGEKTIMQLADCLKTHAHLKKRVWNQLQK
jgi:anaerobic magnesium-protoporphyrin IX monomethyl ester cyclase